MTLSEFITFVSLQGASVKKKRIEDDTQNPVIQGEVWQVFIIDRHHTRYANIIYKTFENHTSVLRCNLRLAGRLGTEIVPQPTFSQIVRAFFDDAA